MLTTVARQPPHVSCHDDQLHVHTATMQGAMTCRPQATQGDENPGGAKSCMFNFPYYSTAVPRSWRCHAIPSDPVALAD